MYTGENPLTQHNRVQAAGDEMTIMTWQNVEELAADKSTWHQHVIQRSLMWAEPRHKYRQCGKLATFLIL